MAPLRAMLEIAEVCHLINLDNLLLDEMITAPLELDIGGLDQAEILSHM